LWLGLREKILNSRDLSAKQIMMSEALWDMLGDLGEEMKYPDRRGSHSKVVREIVSTAVTRWRHSPYVCLSARHVFLVTGCGDVFYRQLQILSLNSKREKLPCSIGIKPEKRHDFLTNRDRKIDVGDWLKSRWLINHFAVWRGTSPKGDPLSSWVDRDGMEYKIADLPVNQGANRKITREIMVGVENYVQWQGSGRDYDRLDVPVDIPTRNLEVVVIIDADLYKYIDSVEEIPDLGVEFRNRECARFEGREVANDPENPMEVSVGRRIHGESSQKTEQVIADLAELEERLKHLAQARVGNEPILEEQDRKRLFQALKMPERFVYCRLSWPSPYLGLDVCIRWEKPLKGEG
jgi:hypothetical protein